MGEHSTCSVCGQDCHCGRFYTGHRCNQQTTVPPRLVEDREVACLACGASSAEVNVYEGTRLCVSRVACTQRQDQRGGGVA